EPEPYSMVGSGPPVGITMAHTVSGTTAGLRDGQVAILVHRFVDRPSRPFLALIEGQLRTITTLDIEEYPAGCALCRQSIWWFDGDTPRCITCERPSADEECAIWNDAHALFQGRGLDAVEGWLDFILTHHPSRHWPIIQRAAFGVRVGSLVEE